MLIINNDIVFQVLNTLFPKLDGEVPEILRSLLFNIHVSAAVLGYSAFALSAVAGWASRQKGIHKFYRPHTHGFTLCCLLVCRSFAPSLLIKFALGT